MDGRTFTLEILEGLAVSRVEELNRQIRRLKEKGFRISIHHLLLRTSSDACL